MRVAWFHPETRDGQAVTDDTRLLVHELRRTHEIDLIDESRAHAFVWRHARQPYDVCVYELANTPEHQYVWPYLLHAPGIVVLRAMTLRDSRAAALAHQRRLADYDAELAFSGRAMLRVPLAAARLVVVLDAARARQLEDQYPDLRVAIAPVGVEGAGVRRCEGAGVRFGVLAGDPGLIERAARRAREAGAVFDLVLGRPLDETLRDADALIALDWPPDGEPITAVLTGMARGTPSIVLETEANAAWPAFDPQSWQPRDLVPTSAPIVVSLDPRDEEHSLMLAMRRLSADAMLRETIGHAAQAWWRGHATVAHAAAAWEHILNRAITLDAPPHPAGWPAHLTADGTEHARGILAEFNASVDFLS